MKKLFILILLLVSINSYSQRTYNLDKPKTVTTLISSSTKTADIAIYKGIKHIIYKSKNNKLFIVVTSKKGTKYKKYLKLDELKTRS
jgi:hypothetical protein